MTELLYWHPDYNVYNLENKLILLLSDRDSYCFSLTECPVLNEVDKGLSTNALLDDITDFENSAYNLYFIQDLIKKGILSKDKKSRLNAKDLGGKKKISSDTVLTRANDIEPITPEENISFFKLSSFDRSIIDDWISVFLDSYHGSGLSTPLNVIFTDCFLDKALSSMIPLEKNWCIIKVNGENIWMTTLSTPDNPIDFSELQLQIRRNQPLRNFVEQLFPNEDHRYPLTENVNVLAECRANLVRLISDQLQSTEHTIGIINSSTYKVKHHYILPYYDKGFDFASQVHAPIVLSSRSTTYAKDGGSRTSSPEKTVALLMKLVSPISGIISHFIEPEKSTDELIKIYKTSYFKTPQTKLYDLLDNSSFLQLCMGKGVSHIQSQASALCEAIERQSAQYQSNEPYLLSRQSELPKRSFVFQELAPYSENQYDNFSNPDHPDTLLSQAAKPYKDSKIPWVSVFSLTRSEHVYLPLSTCFANTPFDDEKFGRWQSNGCAAGNNVEEAILQGLYELIERDASAIWWYNQVTRPEVDLTSIPADNLLKIKATLGKDIDFWVLDITTDTKIPTMVAIARHQTTQKYTLGFGCHLQTELAVQRALTELCQIMSVREQNSQLFHFDGIATGSYLYPDSQQTAVAPFASATDNLKKDIEAIVKQLSILGYETLALNYSRAHIPIKTVKVFVPGMCHIWPQLGNERLYQTPVQLGWQKEFKSETTIHQQALYI